MGANVLLIVCDVLSPIVSPADAGLGGAAHGLEREGKGIEATQEKDVIVKTAEDNSSLIKRSFSTRHLLLPLLR